MKKIIEKKWFLIIITILITLGIIFLTSLIFKKRTYNVYVDIPYGYEFVEKNGKLEQTLKKYSGIVAKGLIVKGFRESAISFEVDFKERDKVVENENYTYGIYIGNGNDRRIILGYGISPLIQQDNNSYEDNLVYKMIQNKNNLYLCFIDKDNIVDNDYEKAITDCFPFVIEEFKLR